jgi:DNA-binding NtrC family response regulator/tetratricopeptide (TPR) repeat protein
MSRDVVPLPLPLFRPAPASAARSAELDLLLREYDEARRTGRARFVVVRGPRGVGKSHLVAELEEALARADVRCFVGGSARQSRKAFWLFEPLVQALLEVLPHTGAAPTRVAQLEARLLTLAEGGAQPGAERLELFDAVAELLSSGVRDCPVVVLPDLDVADRSSLELVRYLGALAQVPASRLQGLFVLTLRDDAPLPVPLPELLAQLPARTLPLAGLDLEGLRAFLQRDDVARRLFETTGGNPDLLEAVLSVPAPAQELLLRRLDRLEAQARRALELVALAPEPITCEVAAQALELTPELLAAQLDLLTRERLVRAQLVEGQLAFCLLRSVDGAAVLQGVAPAARQPLQRALGHALARAGRLESAAEVLLLAAPLEAAPVALRTARALLARGAGESAVVLLERVVPLLGGASRADAARSLAEALLPLGRYRAAARRWLEAARLGAPGLSGPLLLEAARALVKCGRVRWAERLIDRAQAEEGAVDDALQVARAELWLQTGRAKAALELCRAALTTASGEAAFTLENVLGKALLVQGRADEARAVFARLGARAREAGAQGPAALARLNEGVAAFAMQDRAAAVECWTTTPPGHRPAHAQAQANLGSLEADAGDFEPALEHLGRALEAFSRFGGPREVAQAASNLARLELTLGGLTRAQELAEHALALARRLGDGWLEGSALLTLGAVRLEGRAVPTALPVLDEARQRFEGVGHEGYAALAAALKARGHVAEGQRAQAELELSRAVVARGVERLDAARLEVELVRGALCLSANDLLAASRAATRAREALLSRPDLEGPMRTHVLMAQLKLAAHDESGAQAEWLKASRALDELSRRVPPVRRQAFLQLARRGQVLAHVEPELGLPPRLAIPQVVSGGERDGLIGRAASLQRVVRQLDPVGKSLATVLIRGESGTGKELLAQALHVRSPRAQMPLVKVNCAAFVEELLMSELFGHEKGAFTGAIRERKGRFELADGGTIFLDEIGDISPKAQVALLRVLQEREFERVGGTRTLKVDVRVVCATNRDLEGLIAQGRFRADLYYRLKGVMLELPPLRERLDDLPQLAAHFLERMARERGEPVRRLSDEALALLARHPWPGNVRELENVIAAAVIFAETEVVGVEALAHVAELRALLDGAPAPRLPGSASVVPASLVAAAAPLAAPAAEGRIDFYELARARGVSLKELRQEIERQCIERALLDAKGNISEAARLLKMKRSRLSQIVNAEPSLREVARGDE